MSRILMSVGVTMTMFVAHSTFGQCEVAQSGVATALEPATEDWFGYSASISGNSAIVGAYRADESGTDSGAAYVLVREGNIWMNQQQLLGDDSAAEDYFGLSVAIANDTIVIGAPLDDIGRSHDA